MDGKWFNEVRKYKKIFTVEYTRHTGSTSVMRARIRRCHRKFSSRLNWTFGIYIHLQQLNFSSKKTRKSVYTGSGEKEASSQLVQTGVSALSGSLELGYRSRLGRGTHYVARPKLRTGLELKWTGAQQSSPHSQLPTHSNRILSSSHFLVIRSRKAYIVHQLTTRIWIYATGNKMMTRALECSRIYGGRVADDWRRL